MLFNNFLGNEALIILSVNSCTLTVLFQIQILEDVFFPTNMRCFSINILLLSYSTLMYLPD